jgi:hypothetical protein
VTKIIVATPCYGGLVTQRYMQCIYLLLQAAAQVGIHTQLELLGYESLITRGRNTLVAKFLDDLVATHLLFVDADIGFEAEQVLRMLNSDRDVVAGMYPLKLIEWTSAALDRLNGGEPLEVAPLRFVGTPCTGLEREVDGTLVTAEYAGTGLMLIRRNVFERMIDAYPDLRYSTAHNSSVPNRSPNQYAFFDCLIHPDTREYLSEDFSFCKRWRALGGKIWLDTGGTTAHIGTYEFRGSPGGRFSNR